MELKRYRVRYYDRDDIEMDEPLEYICLAESEDDADAACERAHPGCATTMIEPV